MISRYIGGGGWGRDKMTIFSVTYFLNDPVKSELVHILLFYEGEWIFLAHVLIPLSHEHTSSIT